MFLCDDLKHITFIQIRIDLDELVEYGKIVYMKNERKFENPPSAVKLNGTFIILLMIE